MTRLHPAAKAARVLVGFGAILVLAFASGCSGSQAPAPTPDPFAGLADRSDVAFRQGLEAYARGQYRDALTAFEQARTLSPTDDPNINQMIERTKAAMAPTPTPVPPTPTAVPVTPTATPVAMSNLVPDTDLGQRYFGKVTLAMVPGRDSDAPAATQFFFQDQIGLHIDGLKQHLRLPFMLRIFKADPAQLVAQVSSDEQTPSVAPAAIDSAKAALIAAATATASAGGAPDPGARMQAAMALAAAAGSANSSAPGMSNAASGASGSSLVKFWDTYVWYHQGGEEPGRYRLELYANGILTNVFDYTVGTVPIPTPTEVPQPTVAPTSEPTSEPTVAPTFEEAPAPPVTTRPVTSAPSKPAAAPQPTREPTPIPSPTAIPTPATATGITIGGLPAGLDVNPNTGRVFIADGSGVIWANDPGRPHNFNRPVNLGNLPVDLAVDGSTGYVFVSARNESAVVVLDASGRRLSSIPMPGTPGDLQVDSDLGLVYVALPDRQALGVVDGRGGRMLRTIEGLPQITSLAIDPVRHQLYATHLAGQMTVIDVPSSQIVARLTLTGVGLESVAASRGLAYAINTATHELAVVEPLSQSVSRYVLPLEPSAVAASEDSGTVYVLSSKPNTVMRLDPTSGTIVGQVSLGDRGGRFGISTSSTSAFQSLRSRMVLDRADESLYVSLPEMGMLSIVPNDLFPSLSADVPWVQVPEAPIVAATIPGVVRPGAPPLPDQPAPVSAQAPIETTTEEAN